MSGRTGPNDPRRQTDLSLGFEVERDDRVRVGVIVVLSEQEVQLAVQRGLEHGYKRENPNGSWTAHERQGAIRQWLQHLIEEDLKA